MELVEKMGDCPLGSKCKEVKDGSIYRCPWLLDINGTDVEGKPDNKTECAVTWTPIMLMKNLQVLAGIQAATESSRNEIIKAQAQSTQILANTMLVASENNLRLVGENKK